MRSLHRIAAVAACALGGAAWGQLINDGNFDALAVGTPPDNALAAGAWQFPANYITGLAAEVTPADFTIIATSTFDPSASGNSLAININNATANVHVTNLLTTPIEERRGRFVHLKFRVWANSAGVGGGSMYIGADHGGGGFTNTTDRGPQLSWFGDGTLKVATLGAGGVPVNTTYVPAYPFGAWQDVQLRINLMNDTFDLHWGAPAFPMSMVGSGLGFRSGTQAKLDRLTFVHFGATVAHDQAAYDDIAIAVTDCYADCNTSGTLTIADFGCFQSAFAAGETYADCNNSGTLTIADFGCFQSAFAAGCP